MRMQIRPEDMEWLRSQGRDGDIVVDREATARPVRADSAERVQRYADGSIVGVPRGDASQFGVGPGEWAPSAKPRDTTPDDGRDAMATRMHDRGRQPSRADRRRGRADARAPFPFGGRDMPPARSGGRAIEESAYEPRRSHPYAPAQGGGESMVEEGHLARTYEAIGSQLESMRTGGEGDGYEAMVQRTRDRGRKRTP